MLGVGPYGCSGLPHSFLVGFGLSFNHLITSVVGVRASPALARVRAGSTILTRHRTRTLFVIGFELFRSCQRPGTSSQNWPPGRGTPKRPTPRCALVPRKFCRNSSTHINGREQPSGQQLICNCGCACGENGAFEEDGEATIWFEPIDRREQESGDGVSSVKSAS